MKTINSSTDIKTCMSEISKHIKENQETVKGEKLAEILMNISREIYDIRSSNLGYNEKIEFAFLCDKNSSTQLFQVQ